MFCPDCDSILIPIKEENAPKGALQCRDCGYKSTDEKLQNNYIIKDEISEEERSRIEVIEQKIDSGGVPEDMIEELREQYREALENFEV